MRVAAVARVSHPNPFLPVEPQNGDGSSNHPDLAEPRWIYCSLTC